MAIQQSGSALGLEEVSMEYLELKIIKGIEFLKNYGPFNKEATNDFIEKYIEDFRPEDRMLIIPRFISCAKDEMIKHEKTCSEENPLDCSTSNSWKRIIYMMESLLADLAPTTNYTTNDIFFNADEIASIKSKIDDLKEGINISRAENEARFTEVLFEIEDLKTNLYANKKIYKDFFAGRISRLVLEDVLNKTIVKRITNSIFEDFPQLLD